MYVYAELYLAIMIALFVVPKGGVGLLNLFDFDYVLRFFPRGVVSHLKSRCLFSLVGQKSCWFLPRLYGVCLYHGMHVHGWCL